MDDLLIGRKEIMKALHISSWRTVMRKKKKPGFKKLFRKEPTSGKPAILYSEYLSYIESFNKK